MSCRVDNTTERQRACNTDVAATQRCAVEVMKLLIDALTEHQAQPDSALESLVEARILCGSMKRNLDGAIGALQAECEAKEKR